MPGRYRDVICDWSGTIVNDLPPVVDGTNAVLRHFGRPEVTVDSFRREFQLPFSLYYERKLPEVELKAIETVFRDAFLLSTEVVTVLPHAREFLQACRDSGRRLFVLSSAPQEAVEAQATDLGLAEFFHSICGSVVDKRQRIANFMNEHAMDAMETCMIGDMSHDIHTARAGGIGAIAVLTGYEFAETLSAAQPDIMVEHLHELAALMGMEYPAATPE